MESINSRVELLQKGGLPLKRSSKFPNILIYKKYLWKHFKDRPKTDQRVKV